MSSDKVRQRLGDADCGLQTRRAIISAQSSADWISLRLKTITPVNLNISMVSLNTIPVRLVRLKFNITLVSLDITLVRLLLTWVSLNNAPVSLAFASVC